MRITTILCLLFVTGLLASPAEARGGDRAGVSRALLEKGYGLLRNAEQYMASDPARAAKYAREAERVFVDVLNQDPKHAQAALLGGQAAAIAGDVRGAMVWIQRLGRIAPGGRSDPDYYYLVAFTQVIADKRPDRAVRTLTRMYSLNARARPVERDNLWFRALSDHGANLLDAEKEEQAIVQFRAAMRIAKRLGNRRFELSMLANIGTALIRADRYIEATEIYEGLVKVQPQSPLWHFRLAVCHANQSLFAKAIPVYREVVRLIESGQSIKGLEKDVGMVRLRLGNCLRHLATRQRDKKKAAAMYAEAETLIRHFIKQDPTDSRGHKWLGVLLFENLNRPHEALPYFEKAFELDPVCDDALRHMIQIRRNYPPPKGMTLEEWQKPLPGLVKDLEDGRERREKAREVRLKKNPGHVCG